MKTIYCTNCGKIGHNYKNCKNPIISYFIMLFKYELDEFKLLVQKEDSIAYIEFIGENILFQILINYLIYWKI